MRHRRSVKKLGRNASHRKAMLANLTTTVLDKERIQTTDAKAKVARRYVDRMITLAKRGDLHARRLLISRLACSETAHSLITHVAPHFKERKGGYTRVLRLGHRRGDAAPTALLEFTVPVEAPKTKKPKKTWR